MRIMLPVLAAAGLVFAPIGVAYATCFGAHASAEAKMTVSKAQTANDEEAMTTFDPEKLKLEDEETAE